MFHKADLVLVTKIDLLPHLPQIDLDAIQRNLVATMPRPAMLLVSSTTGQGIDN
jgi:hydrogenase nickel incorporation protein HypB